MSDWNLYNRPCRQCHELMRTTSTKQVVHPECRRAYYARMRNNPAGFRKMRIERARSRWFINDQPCAACGYAQITRKKEFINPATQAKETHHLCPRCLAEIRCGFMEALTWKAAE